MPKSKHIRKNKRRNKAKPSPQRRASESQALYMRSFEISDDIKDTYRPGIMDEIVEATLKFKEGRVKEAQADFASIIEREPRAKEAHMNLAVTYAELGDEATAETLTRQTIEKFPHYAMPCPASTWPAHTCTKIKLRKLEKRYCLWISFANSPQLNFKTTP